MMADRSDGTRARAALIFLTMIWGTSFVAIDVALESASPFVLVTVRFALSAVLLAMIRPKSIRSGFSLLIPSLPLSLSMLGGFALQTIGLETTTPARSAFITSLSVVIVPILDVLDTKHLPRWKLAASVGLAILGVWLLFRPLGLEWRRGDTYTLIGSAIFAYYIVELAKRAREHDSAGLVLAQSVTIAVLAAPLALFAETPRLSLNVVGIGTLLYLGLVCTVFTFVVMTWAQARVGPVEAAVIYTLEPVLAAAFSIALGRELFTPKFLYGGGLVVLAMLIAGTDPSEPHPVAPPAAVD